MPYVSLKLLTNDDVGREYFNVNSPELFSFFTFGCRSLGVHEVRARVRVRVTLSTSTRLKIIRVN